MGEKSHKKGGLNLTFIIQDMDWRKLGTFKWNSSDNKRQTSILRTLKDAFGISLKEKSDLDWAK